MSITSSLSPSSIPPKQPKSLRTKIFYSIFGVATLIEILVFIFLGIAFDRMLEKQAFENLKNEALQIKLQMQNSNYLNFWSHYPYRITLVDSSGKVLYDNRLLAEDLPNHLSHQEIQEALSTKQSASSKRFSQSLNQKTLYYAIFLPEYNLILRVATSQNQMYQTQLDFVPYMLCIIFITLIASFGFAWYFTKSIINPINALGSLESKETLLQIPYIELSGFISKIYTQKKKIKKQLKIISLKQQEFEAISQNIDEGFMRLNAIGEVLSFNHKAQKIFAQTEIGLNVTLHEDFLKYFKHIDFSSPQIQTSEQQINGLYIEMITFPIHSKSKFNGFVVLLLDKSADFKIQNLRKEFSANVTHELKTPLSVIIASSEMIKNNMILPQDLPEFADKIYLESTRLLDIINDILKLSFFDEGTQHLEKSLIDLYALSKLVLKSLENPAQQKNISLRVIGEKCEVLGIENLLWDMIYNLCENAIKYNIEGGSVEICTSKQNNKAILSIKDSGIGIPKESLDRVFERFYRVDKGRSKKFGGTGLGLSIVKHIALYHNAKITLNSEVGAGSEVIVTFDL
ncbi:ATP-binding protein [Helicobacter fennelliae]|uniref:histidine kinase n=2 Tax=Helicobacter fennelliae TaxID=215 RepID=T1CSN0_9HELI|nr:ATP-binding protein [Helicobacter fennelliae]GAD19824.1 phosphate regulon sensor protein PhoR [Helicobacter fennelliae MRY12-0050]GAD20032.1 phosphate regulon sensor protein PhoR [Helicobacter fennelliae MRY12-0050]SQB98644.1 phosphate regulon sensor histidine kinase [Helicobacter fennelliae]STP07985.1 phosphate regulon sensor histidine kinase [Helicobacter fennelliae]